MPVPPLQVARRVTLTRDEHWTGSGLWQILLNLDWMRTIISLQNLGSGPELD